MLRRQITKRRLRIVLVIAIAIAAIPLGNFLYVANVEADFLVLHGPPEFWPSPWTLSAVGDVSTFALTVFAVGYGLWITTARRIYRWVARSRNDWPVRLGMEGFGQIQVRDDRNGRLEELLISVTFKAEPARWTFSPTNYPRVLEGRLTTELFGDSPLIRLGDDLASDLPYIKEFRIDHIVKGLSRLDDMTLKIMLAGVHKIGIEVDGVLPPGKPRTSKMMTKAIWIDDAQRTAVITNLIPSVN